MAKLNSGGVRSVVTSQIVTDSVSTATGCEGGSGLCAVGSRGVSCFVDLATASGTQANNPPLGMKATLHCALSHV